MTPATAMRVDSLAPRHQVVAPADRAAPRPRAATVLMTSTLRPPAAAITRHDLDARLRDYRDALLFNLALPDEVVGRVVFVDNSNTDLDALVDAATRTAHRKTVEFISFQGNDHPPEKGKAHGEFRLIDHGLSASRTIGADDVVWKTTGRLKLLNLPELHRATSPWAFDLLCDLHNVPFVGTRSLDGRRSMDLRCFAFNRAGYDAVLRGLWKVPGPNLDATIVYDAVMAARGRLRVRPRFPRQPRLQGISGRHGRDYQSLSQRSRDNVRAVLRRVAPGIWL